LEWVLPRSICKRLLPVKAFNRLFHKDLADADIYDVYADECQQLSEQRKSEVKQVIDTFGINDIQLDGKVVLDISGGPGYVAKELNNICDKCIVTEFSAVATKAIAEHMNIETVKFDYNSDQLEDLFDSSKFDVVMLRSSIIFCENLGKLISSIRHILKPEGYVLLESGMPTLGEVFWWQTMDYKFPFLYSQETIEKLFYKHGFSLIYGQRDYESYLKVMNKTRTKFSHRVFAFAFEYPLVLFYYLLARKSKISIDPSLNHKMLAQIWQKSELTSNTQKKPYRNYYIGNENQSIHFASIYNNYLRKQ
jgi:ubiquinone/menaquinone biosynthesis C-methylase UbiE